jgi:hypothetical protein
MPCKLRFCGALFCLSMSLFKLSAIAADAPSPRDIAAKKYPRDQWGAALVDVSHDAEKRAWILQGKKHTVDFNEKTLALKIQAGPMVWSMIPSGANDMLIKSGDDEFPMSLADAGRIDIVPYDAAFKTGVKIKLDDWPGKSGRVKLPLYLTIALEGPDEELVFDIAADEREAKVRRLDWPAALDSKDIDFTVLSNGRGALLPRNWPKWYHPIRSKEEETTEVQSNVIESWSMSWWGFQRGPSAMMVIVETPDDAAYQFEHPAGGPTMIGPRWRESLGQLRYPRSCRMCFFEQGNYVDLAKRYRRYAMDTGLFVSLAEKITRRPVVKELIGTPQTRLGILTNIKPDSLKYNKTDPNANHRMTTFDDRAKQLEQMKAAGLEHLVVVLTGWPREGYDRQHPDELPPAPEAGGVEGMKRLADKCHELGYLFSLHDQYRDYYTDAPSYDPQFAVHEESAATPPHGFPGTRFGTWKEGQLEFMNNWDGGTMSYLNNRFMPGHLIKTYGWLFDHGVHPQGIYLDVFGYVPPDEDFNPEHPTTRSDAIRARMLCYNWSRNNLGFVGTEAGCDWTVPYVDCVSSMKSPTKYIPVPLYNLVYHDAVMMAYSPDDLRGFLNAGVPQLGRMDAGRDGSSAMKRMSALHKRLALQEMTKHEFLDDQFHKERTTFADGTTVTVDWDANKVEIKPDLAAAVAE